ncbi:nitroreductase family deazaflavin-dependent oxidoreductase [Nocardia sp. NPDC052001]|uniref:nitroreductase family deazaflavin-dependent oxidoreductase n=1 Tax=unclassified Nocardia TaxID=2637762 RepID=UPI00341BCA56
MSTPDLGASMFPAWFDRLQVKYMNPVMRRAAPYLPTFAVIHHAGRKSGKPYTTPVNAFRSKGKFTVVLGHGVTDWVRNVLAAGEADVQSQFRTIRITNPRIVEPGQAGPDLPLPARVAGGRFGVLVADIA